MAKTTIPAGYFAAGSIATADIAANAITSAKLAQNSVLTKHIDDNQVGIDQLNVSDGSDGQVLTTNGSGTLSFSTVSGTTINNNADNRVITGSGTANTLEGESNFTFNASTTRCSIGGSSPTHILTLESGASDGYEQRRVTIKSANHGGNAGFRFTLEDSGGNTRGGGYYFEPATSSDDSYLNLSANDSSCQMAVFGDGRVAIGNTAPTLGLEVHRSHQNAPILELKNTHGGGYSGIHFRNNSDTLIGHVGYGNATAGNSSLQDLVYFGSITTTDVGFTSADAVRLKLTSAGHLVPTANNSYDLGSATLGFRNIYTNDLNLSNMAPEGVDADGNAYTRPGNDVDGTNGSWTIQEGADDLFIINRTNGKKYRFNLTEVTD